MDNSHIQSYQLVRSCHASLSRILTHMHTLSPKLIFSDLLRVVCTYYASLSLNILVFLKMLLRYLSI